MASITLEFAQFSHFDSFEVIRSLTSMASTPDSALPAPIATGLKTMHYIDTTVTEGVTYFYRVRVLRGNDRFVSDELRVVATEYLLNLPFSTDLSDHGRYGLVATTYGGAVVQDGYLYIPPAAYVRYNTAGGNDLNLNTDDFEIGLEVAVMPTGNGSYPCILGVGMSWVDGALSMQFNPESRFMAAILNPSEKDAFAPSTQARDGETFVKYAVQRVSGVWTTYKDGVAGTQMVDSTFIADFTRHGVITIGAALWALDITASHSKIKNVYLKRL